MVVHVFEIVGKLFPFKKVLSSFDFIRNFAAL